MKTFLNSLALRLVLVVLLLRLNPVIPVFRQVQAPAGRQSRPRVELLWLQVQEDQEAPEAPEPHDLLCYRGIQSLNYPDEEMEEMLNLFLTPRPSSSNSTSDSPTEAAHHKN